MGDSAQAINKQHTLGVRKSLIVFVIVVTSCRSAKSCRTQVSFVAIFGCGANTDAARPDLEIVGWPVLNQQAFHGCGRTPSLCLTFGGGMDYPFVVGSPNPRVEVTNVKLEQT